MKRVCVAGGLVLLLVTAAVGGQTIRKSGRYTIVEVEKSLSVEPNGSLRLSGPADVTVTGWSESQISIHEVIRLKRASRRKAEEVAREAEADYEKRGNEVVISTDHLPRRDASARFEIRVPHQFNLDIDTQGGDISAEALQGNQQLRTSGGDVHVREIEGTLEANTSGGDIQAEDIQGRGRLKTAGGDISVERASARLTVRTSGGDIKLRRVKGPVSAFTSGGDIRVLGSSDDLRLKTSGGDVRVEDATGQVDAFTSGGDIQLLRCNGKVRAETSGGDIQLRRVGKARVSTSGGDVEAEMVTGGIRTSTSGGDVRLTEIQGFIEAQTSGGDVVAELASKDCQTDHHVQIRSSGGDIRLSIPKDLPATIRATIETRSGSIEDFELRTDFKLEVTKRKRGGRGEIRAEGDINGGGDLIELHTVEGDITIRALP